jgi:hypothetical protein
MNAHASHTKPSWERHTMRRTISSVAATLALTALVTAACNKKLRDYGEVDGHAGDSGKPGKSEGGQGGDAGPGQGETLSVVDVAPPSGAVDVERDVPIVVTFSAAVDPESVTTSTFEVVGVNGPIAGTLTVEDEVVTFRPERRWHLHSEVTVKVSTDLKGGRGERLAEGAESSFFVRDGEFGDVQLLSPQYLLNMEGIANDSGDTVVAWSNADLTEITAAVFHPNAAEWTAEAVRSTDGEESRNPRVAINGSGNALVTWENFQSTASLETPDSAGWARYSRSSGWSAVHVLDRTGTPGRYVAVGLGDDGVALGVWSRSLNGTLHTWASWLTTEWSSPTPLADGFREPRVSALRGGEFLALFANAETGSTLIRSANADEGWYSQTTFNERVALAVSGGEALATVHANPATAARYKDGVWTNLGTIAPAGAATGTIFPQPYAKKGRGMFLWLTNTSILQARFWEGEFEDEVFSLGTSPDIFFRGVLDTAGNAFVYWWVSESVTVARRYRRGEGWSSERTMPGFGTVVSADSEGNLLYVYGNEDGAHYLRFE